MSNPYDILGVPRGSSVEEAHAAMKRLAQLYHPDKYAMANADVRAEAERRMKDVNAAYDAIRSGGATLDDETFEEQVSAAYRSAMQEALAYDGPACDICGHAPTAPMTFKYGVGKLFVREVHGFQGDLCSACGKALFRDAQDQTLLKGWWGMISFFANWTYILSNLANLAKANRLSPATPTPRVVLAPLPRPLQQGRPILRRAGVWVAAVAMVLAGGIGASAYEESQGSSNANGDYSSSTSGTGSAASTNSYVPPVSPYRPPASNVYATKDCAYTIGDTVYRVSCGSPLADYEIADEVFDESACPYETEFYTEEGFDVICWTSM